MKIYRPYITDLEQNLIPQASGTLQVGTTAFSWNAGVFENLQVNVTPTAPLDVANKAYVDSAVSTANEFIELTDTPSTYSGANASGVRVNAGGTGLEFYDITPYTDPDTLQIVTDRGATTTLAITTGGLTTAGVTTSAAVAPDASGTIDLGSIALAFDDAYIDKVYLEADPTTPLQAATKQYVDAQISGVDEHNELGNLNWAAAGHTIDADIVPTASGTINLGSAALAFNNVRADNVYTNDIYVAGESVHLGNRNLTDASGALNIDSNTNIGGGVFVTDTVGIGAGVDSLQVSDYIFPKVLIKKEFQDNGGNYGYGLWVAGDMLSKNNQSDWNVGIGAEVVIPTGNDSDNSNNYFSTAEFSARHYGDGDLYSLQSISSYAQSHRTTNAARTIGTIDGITQSVGAIDGTITLTRGALIGASASSVDSNTYATDVYGVSVAPSVSTLLTKSLNVENIYGVHVKGQLQELSTGPANVVNWYGIYSADPTIAVGTPVITNQYGIYAEQPTQGSNNYTIYTTGGEHSFGGNVVVHGNVTASGVIAPEASGTRDLGTISAAFNNAYIDKVYLEADPTTPLQAATKQYVDSQSHVDAQVAVDAAATPDYIGAAAGDGVLRVDSTFDYTDGGNYVTLGLDSTLKSNYDAAYSHISADGSSHTYINQSVTTAATPSFAGLTTTGSVAAGASGTLDIGTVILAFNDAHINKVYLEADPTDDLGAATKQYVDAAQAAAAPGGTDTMVQYNNGGALGGAVGLTYNDGTQDVTFGNDILATASGTQDIGTATLRFGTAHIDVVKADSVEVLAPTAGNEAANKDYVDSIAQGLDWQPSVLDFLGAPPVGPSTGNRYIATASASGWTDNNIYEYNGATWDETVSNEGFAAWVENIDELYVFNGADWVQFGSAINHNSTTGKQGGTTDEYYHLTATEYAGDWGVKNITTDGSITGASVVAETGLTVGQGGDVDYAITFNANTSDGTITYLEDESRFSFDQDIQMSTVDLKVQSNHFTSQDGASAYIDWIAPEWETAQLFKSTSGFESNSYYNQVGDNQILWDTSTWKVTGGFAPYSSGNIDLGTIALAFDDAHINKVYLEADPTVPLQAATKQYVDAQVAGVNEFIELTDTPGSYAGMAASGVRVNTGTTGLEFYDATAPRSGHLHTQSVASTTWVITHNLNNTDVIVQVTDGQNPENIVIPYNIELTDANTTTITFPTAQSGKARIINLVLA